MEQPVGFETPRHGPFELVPRFAFKQWTKAVLLAILFLGMASLMGWFGAGQAANARFVSDTWENGVEAAGQIGFEGEVTTHSFILKDYELKVTFDLPDGSSQTVEAEFQRFFTGPDENDEMDVRYLAADPTQAVTSWQKGAIVHMWIWVALITALVGLMAFGGVLFFRNLTRVSSKATAIARSGTIDVVDVVKSEQTAGDYPELKLSYKLASGEEHEQSFPLRGGGPFAVEDDKLLAMVALDRRTSHILRADGWPLVWPPVAPGSRR